MAIPIYLLICYWIYLIYIICDIWRPCNEFSFKNGQI